MCSRGRLCPCNKHGGASQQKLPDKTCESLILARGVSFVLGLPTCHISTRTDTRASNAPTQTLPPCTLVPLPPPQPPPPPPPQPPKLLPPPPPPTTPTPLSTSSTGHRQHKQGLTLVHFSAQLEPCLTHKKHLTRTLGKHHLNPLNTGYEYTIPTRTPHPIQSAPVELKSGRV